MMKTGLSTAENSRRLSREAAAQLREIAHELRNPLNALTAIDEIFRDQRFGPLPGDKYPEYAEMAHGATMRMLELCDRLLIEDTGVHAVATSPDGQVLYDIARQFAAMEERTGGAVERALSKSPHTHH